MTGTHRAAIETGTIVGTEAVPVTVEVDIGSGLPAFIVVGLGDTAVLEARDRVRSAIRACGYRFPNARVVVNLAPSPLRKHGTGFDLPMAASILLATGQIPADGAADHWVGELSLDGRVRPVPGLLAHALTARASRRVLVTAAAGLEHVSIVDSVDVRAIGRLDELRERRAPSTVGAPRAQGGPRAPVEIPHPDLREVTGHEIAKRALEISATGEHNLLMVGPPGSGKTMLARRLPGLLPPLAAEERLEAAVIHDISGLNSSAIVDGGRPFRAPHHSCSMVGLVGGGTPPRPGEISLAHTGVLFLDELPQFGPAALQALRQPLEDESVTLVRAEGRVRFPSRFTLVASANPCPCGFLGDPDRTCTCAIGAIQRYRNRIGGPLMDRIDLALRVDRIDPGRLLGSPSGEDSPTVRDRIASTRARIALSGRLPSGRLSGDALLRACGMGGEAVDLLTQHARRHHLSGRAVTRLLRVARTIADIEGEDSVSRGHIDEASGYRMETP